VDVRVAAARGSPPLVRELLASSAPVPFVLCTDLEGRALTVTAAACKGGLGSPDLNDQALARARDLLAQECGSLETIRGRSIFFDAFDPPPALVICGAEWVFGLWSWIAVLDVSIRRASRMPSASSRPTGRILPGLSFRRGAMPS
jgi:hypothetical protein